jgi:hypothetical protein
MTDLTPAPYYQRGGEQRARMQERDTREAHEKAAERGKRTYQLATSAQFTPEATGEDTQAVSDSKSSDTKAPRK